MGRLAILSKIALSRFHICFYWEQKIVSSTDITDAAVKIILRLFSPQVYPCTCLSVATKATSSSIKIKFLTKRPEPLILVSAATHLAKGLQMPTLADVAELADAQASGACELRLVEVRLLSSAFNPLRSNPAKSGCPPSVGTSNGPNPPYWANRVFWASYPNTDNKEFNYLTKIAPTGR